MKCKKQLTTRGFPSKDEDMKKLIAVVVLTISSCGALAPAAEMRDMPDGSAIVILTPAERAACESGGGCVIAPEEIIKLLVERAKRSCGVDI